MSLFETEMRDESQDRMHDPITMNTQSNADAHESVRQDTRETEVRGPTAVWKWTEGEGARSIRVVCPAGPGRERVASMLARTLIPQLERRRVVATVMPAHVPEGFDSGDVRWVCWRESRSVVWALYVATRRLERVSVVANDALTIVAWGDGPVLAWIDSREESRRVFRSAMMTPPSWLFQGMISGDATFAFKVERVYGATTCADPAPILDPVAMSTTTNATPRLTPDQALDLLRSWSPANQPAGENRPAPSLRRRA